MSREFCDWMKNCDCRTTILQASDLLQEDEEYLRENYILAMLLLMFDNDFDMGKEDYLLQLIVQSMDLGVLENIIYSIMEALKKYVTKRTAGAYLINSTKLCCFVFTSDTQFHVCSCI